MKFLRQFAHVLGALAILGLGSLAIITSFIARDLIDPSQIVNFPAALENQFYDWRFTRLQENHSSNIETNKSDITLVEIDDKTLQSLNVWPIPRHYYASLLNRLTEIGVKAIAFDVMFPEPSRSCETNTLNDDDLFAQAIENAQQNGVDVILAYTTQSWQGEDSFKEIPEKLYEQILDSSQSSQENLQARYVEKMTYPIEKLTDTMAQMAFINMQEDSDGVFRHYQLVANLDNFYFPSLALKAYQSLAPNDIKLEINSQATAKLKLSEQDSLFVNHKGESKIRWTKDLSRYQTISFADTLKLEKNDPIARTALKDKIVFIGSTSSGAHDFRNTPIDAKLPGVYAHMNMADMLLNKYFYRPQEESIKWSFAIYFAGAAILFTLMYFGSATLDILGLALVLGSALYIDVKYLLPYGYEIKLFFILASYILSYSWMTLLNFASANAEKKQIKGAFGRYVSPAIVNDMLGHPEKLKVGGERKDITCLFSDIRDFTSISEKLSPNDLSLALNHYMGKMTDIIFETHGTLDKYIGDAIVAFWGAPLEIGDHVTKAVQASVLMMEALEEVNLFLSERGLPQFKVGIGLNSGECSVGNMGSDQIFAYTALGDTMNLGARLESLCKHYGAQILISEMTHERMQADLFQTRKIDNVVVKGKEKAVGVYEVFYNSHPYYQNSALQESYRKAYQSFCEKNFKEAIRLFDEVISVYPSDPSGLRLKALCESYLADPPAPELDHTISIMHTK